MEVILWCIGAALTLYLFSRPYTTTPKPLTAPIQHPEADDDFEEFLRSCEQTRKEVKKNMKNPVHETKAERQERLYGRRF